jgi:hypothetical protein
MPYIKSNDGRREALQQGDIAQSAGELNYQIFYYVKNRIENNYIPVYLTIKMFVNQFLGNTPNYQKYNDMTGALIRCEKEIKRRLGITVNQLTELMESYDRQIDIYEDLKILENGDV